jgi:hypothetical protein
VPPDEIAGRNVLGTMNARSRVTGNRSEAASGGLRATSFLCRQSIEEDFKSGDGCLDIERLERRR